jgi:hypothetical protein
LLQIEFSDNVWSDKEQAMRHFSKKEPEKQHCINEMKVLKTI